MGAEGCGIIEKVGSSVNKEFIGKKVAFTYGAWSNFVIKEQSQVIVFNNAEVQSELIARAFVNPMTALCLKQKIRDIITEKKKVQSKGRALVFFLGAESSLG